MLVSAEFMKYLFRDENTISFDGTQTWAGSCITIIGSSNMKLLGGQLPPSYSTKKKTGARDVAELSFTDITEMVNHWK